MKTLASYLSNGYLSSLEERLVRKHLDGWDRRIVGMMRKYGVRSLRVGLGVVFVWFGMLKFFPGLSPAEDLVRNTIYFVNPDLFIPVLAAWEVLIGIGLIANYWMRATLLLLFLQMGGTAMPLVILPDVCWQQFPFVLTLEGQYILKNLVLIGAGLAIGATLRRPAPSDSK